MRSEASIDLQRTAEVTCPECSGFVSSWNRLSKVLLTCLFWTPLTYSIPSTSSLEGLRVLNWVYGYLQHWLHSWFALQHINQPHPVPGTDQAGTRKSHFH